MISGVIVFGFFLFWMVVYLPAQMEFKRLKAQLKGANDQISQIELMVTKGETMNTGAKILEQRFREVNYKFPQKEEAALEMLSELGQKLGMGVLSTKSQPKTPFLDKDGQPVMVEGRACQKVFVLIEMKSSYAELVHFLETIDKQLPAYMIVERLEIRKDTAASLKLNIVLGFNLYFLS